MEKTDNRSTGNRFEQEMSFKLAEKGFWVHVLQQNKFGQPADIIAIRDSFHTLIDCKVCEKNYFSFDRVEQNQQLAMKSFFRKTGELSYFALKMPDGAVRMISMSRIEQLKGRGKKRLNEKDIQTETRSFEDWLYFYDRSVSL